MMRILDTRRQGRRRRRREVEPPGRTLARGLVVIALLGFLGWLSASFYNGIPGRDYVTVFADVPRVGNLLPHDPVRIAGVRVGQVSHVSPGPNGRARVKLQLEPGTKLPADTGVEVRANGLLGARYVQLNPGTSGRLLASGETIRGSGNALTFGVPEALDTFDPKTRAALGSTLKALGGGVLGQGRAVNDAVRLSSGQMEPFQRLTEDILARPGAAERLIPSLDRAASGLSDASRDLARLPGPGTRALQPLIDERPAVRQALAEAPSALAAATAGLGKGTRLLTAARDLATASVTTLRSAPAGLESASALLEESRVPLRRTLSLLRAAEPAIPAAMRIVNRVSPLLAPLRSALDDLAPMLTQVGRYRCDIVNFGVVFRSMTGFGGVGEGPAGPAMQFRLQVVPSTEVVGLRQAQVKVTRDGYPEPCKYLASRYPALTLRDPGGGAR